MAQRHRQLVLAVSLVFLPWLGCTSSGDSPTGTDGGVAGASGTAGTHAGGTTADGGTHTGGSTGGTGTHMGGSIGAGSGGSTGGSGSVSPGPAGTGGAAGTWGGAGDRGTSGEGAMAGAMAGTGSAGRGGTGGATGAGGAIGAAGATGVGGSGSIGGPAGTTGTGGSGSSGGPAGTTGAGGSGSSGGPAGTIGAGGSGSSGGTHGGTGAAGTTGTGTGTAGTTGTGGTTSAGNAIKNVFVIAMENEPAAAIYGNKNTPYLNGLLTKYAHATAFTDPLPDSIPSEPHYVWMEAGTNKFSDVTFTGDEDPSSGNSTKSAAHLSAQMMAASPPVSWMGVMEGLDGSTGACPVNSSGFYAAKHDPFVFFQDMAGSPPSESSALCGAHHKAFTSGQALVGGTVAQYTFISPNVCNDMHGDSSCPSGDPIAMGDAWLAANVPPLIDYVNAHSGVIFIVWDEPEGGSALIPFFAIGPHVKPGYTSTAAFTHSSLVKTVEEIFGLPILPTVASASDLADLFQAGTLP